MTIKELKNALNSCKDNCEIAIFIHTTDGREIPYQICTKPINHKDRLEIDLNIC